MYFEISVCFLAAMQMAFFYQKLKPTQVMVLEMETNSELANMLTWVSNVLDDEDQIGNLHDHNAEINNFYDR